MLAKVSSCAVVGLDGALVDVEVDISNGQPGIYIVGLPDAAVQESRERIRSAIKNSSLAYPWGKRITVNLAPGDLRKEGPAYDLPMVVGLLLASEQIHVDLSRTLIIGELSLDGMVRHTNVVLSMAALARERGVNTLLVPASDAPDAAPVPDIKVIPIETLFALVAHINGLQPIAPFRNNQEPNDSAAYATDSAEVRGQEHVKRALEIAAAGQHNILMMGPPGAGKTLLARSMPSILPNLDLEEALEVTRIYSVNDMLPSDSPLIRHRPFRSPHHTISHARLVGGGRWPRPGEISLAHRGVMYLDELPEFDARSLESLRQPLEDNFPS